MGLRRPGPPPKELSSGMESDSSEASFRPYSDTSDESYPETDATSTELTSPEPPRLPSSRPRSEQRPGLEALADYSDGPDDNTDEDIHDVPLDYGRSENTKIRGKRIEQRWHKWASNWTKNLCVGRFTKTWPRYCGVKASERDPLPKWSDPEEAIRLVTPNDVHRFLNYCMKLKSGQDGRRLKGIKKATSLRADWKSLRGFYRKITRSSISEEFGEEVNAVGFDSSALACLQGTDWPWPRDYENS
jgi:hypothetical protein